MIENVPKWQQTQLDNDHIVSNTSCHIPLLVTEYTAFTIVGCVMGGLFSMTMIHSSWYYLITNLVPRLMTKAGKKPGIRLLGRLVLV